MTKWCSLFVLRILSYLKVCDSALKQSKLGRLILFGEEKLQDDLNIINIVKKIRYMNTLAKCTDLSSIQRLNIIMHSEDNVIDVDSNNVNEKAFMQQLYRSEDNIIDRNIEQLIFPQKNIAYCKVRRTTVKNKTAAYESMQPDGFGSPGGLQM